MSEAMENPAQRAVRFADPALPLVVVVAATLWDEPPRMRHHITRQLMRWANVLFVEMTDLPGEEDRVMSGRLCLFRCQKSHRVPTRLYANDMFTHGMLNREYARRIKHYVENLRGSVKIIFNFVYDFPEVMRTGAWDLSVYVCFDEFPRMWRARRVSSKLHYAYQSRLLQHYENQVARAADLCLTPHAGLAKKLRNTGSDVRLLYHAHEFSIHERGTHPPVVDCRDGCAIEVAFMGFIHYRLLDDWLLALLRDEDVRLNLIGPVASKYSLRSFEDYPNFRHIPPQVGDDLAGTLSKMDVLIMPYDPILPEVEVLTTTSKLFQYIATGKPIVTSDLPNLLEMPSGVLYEAKSADDFVEQVRRAHAENEPEFVRLRAGISKENTWDRRGEQLHGYLRDALGDRIPDLEGTGERVTEVDL